MFRILYITNLKGISLKIRYSEVLMDDDPVTLIQTLSRPAHAALNSSFLP
ncbi:MAG: hypothetical protein ACI9EX_001815 [Oleispira sp.]|jgi:hypothetical protein